MVFINSTKTKLQQALRFRITNFLMVDFLCILNGKRKKFQFAAVFAMTFARLILTISTSKVIRLLVLIRKLLELILQVQRCNSQTILKFSKGYQQVLDFLILSIKTGQSKRILVVDFERQTLLKLLLMV